MRHRADLRNEDYAETWYVVFRRLQPVAIFPLQSMALGWIKEGAHRAKDTVAARKITFKGQKTPTPSAGT